jgi:hypothetical protein
MIACPLRFKRPLVLACFLIIYVAFSSYASFPAFTEIDKQRINEVLKQAYELDQKYRRIVDSLMKAEIYNEELAVAAYEMKEQDKRNIELVLPIIDSIIHYRIDDLDTLSYKACYLVIQHADVDIHNKYVDFVHHLAQKGYIPSLNYAWFVDRLLVGQGKVQKYGVQAYRYINNVTLLYPVGIDYLESWNELGLEFDPKIWDNCKYSPALVSPNEFALLGFILHNSEGAEGIKVQVNESIHTLTTSTGYFCLVFNKELIPNSIQIVTSSATVDYKLDIAEDADFIVVTYDL